jgi:adenylate cyclase
VDRHDDAITGAAATAESMPQATTMNAYRVWVLQRSPRPPVAAYFQAQPSGFARAGPTHGPRSSSLAYAAWVTSSAGAPISGPELERRIRTRLIWAAVLANGLGGVIVLTFLVVLVPVRVPDDDVTPLIVRNLIAVAILGPATLVLGVRLGNRLAGGLRESLLADRPPTDEERRTALRQPLTFATISGSLWVGAALFFAVFNIPAGAVVATVTGVTILLGGLTTSALGYLLAERITRPGTARALAGDPPERPIAPGVRARLTMAWTVATGVPLLGIVAVAVADLAGNHPKAGTSAGSIVFLAAVGLIVGLLATVIAAGSIADPLAGVRLGLKRVESGDLDAEVAVDDSSEIGLVQAGFNRMAVGLRERERLHDLFGRHVGADVARAALEQDVALGGEERDIAALFVDVTGSTTLAASRPPSEVVALLNAFFAIVVEVTDARGGLVNKFEGDAALCIFGAPVDRPDAAGAALRAARELSARLERELPQIDVGIGVSAGRAVAGNIGAEHRFEYTVIGDPVNEAARLCELAKRRPQRLLASDAAVDRASRAEAAHWGIGEPVTLRGRTAPTRLATVAG